MKNYKVKIITIKTVETNYEFHIFKVYCGLDVLFIFDNFTYRLRDNISHPIHTDPTDPSFDETLIEIMNIIGFDSETTHYLYNLQNAFKNNLIKSIEVEYRY